MALDEELETFVIGLKRRDTRNILTAARAGKTSLVLHFKELRVEKACL